MAGSANAARSGKGAIVKYTVTGTQFQQLLRTYRVFILSVVDPTDFVADIAPPPPYFKDFDAVLPPHYYIGWTPALGRRMHSRA